MLKHNKVVVGSLLIAATWRTNHIRVIRAELDAEWTLVVGRVRISNSHKMTYTTRNLLICKGN